MEIVEQLIKESQAADSTIKIETRALAQKGDFRSALSVRKDHLNSWIVDLGASDHMTGDRGVLTNFSPCHENITISIADGSLSKVIGTGSVKVSKDLTLNSVLLMPKLNWNLLSVSKLTRDFKCVTKFSLIIKIRISFNVRFVNLQNMFEIPILTYLTKNQNPFC